ncbi:hypothetical protein A8C56_10005 [Niabella ginsenosidivorans]|uniref:Uncharacterized protein n=1 Tax=Niabella ginsenosidivorans TaxID=1176587 RepID=A0A1A9I3X4_9BACT|nr:hypothetical protein A8C56_10005 [Niabella ginsenosidivorans]
MLYTQLFSHITWACTIIVIVVFIELRSIDTMTNLQLFYFFQPFANRHKRLGQKNAPPFGLPHT